MGMTRIIEKSNRRSTPWRRASFCPRQKGQDSNIDVMKMLARSGKHLHYVYAS